MSRSVLLLGLLLCALLAACGGGGGGASNDSGGDSGGGIGQSLMLNLPGSGLTASELVVVVAQGDALSEAVGAAYVAARGIPAANLVRVKVNTASDAISESDFAVLRADILTKLPAGTQATLLTWSAPSRVQGACSMGITSAMALGFDVSYCTPPTIGCTATASSPLYDSESRRPATELNVMPSMLLGARSLAEAQALIQRGLSAEATFPAGDGWLVRTSDADRSVRATDFATLPAAWAGALTLNYVDNSAGPAVNDSLVDRRDILFYLTGLANVGNLATLQFRPGALADSLTSFGGRLPGANGQTPITDWIAAGVTATYGTVEEPCNYQQKFSRASVLIDHYWRGESAVEAYWKAVEMPGQGLFVGDPLARPFRDTPSFAIVGGQYQIRTRSLRPGATYSLQYRTSAAGGWTTLAQFTGVRGRVLDGRAPLPPAAAVQIRWVGPCPDGTSGSCALAQSQ